MSSDHLKNNGAKLSRLLIDQGTETMRNYFNFIHPPATLTAVLNANRGRLNKLHTHGHVITTPQMNLLFPPVGSTSSNDYDISLLFILLRNICGLTKPATGWNANPPSHVITKEADLVRIKYYRNTIYGHNKSTEVSDVEFNKYWSEIKGALVRLGANAADIATLKNSPLNEDHYIDLLNEWFENDKRIEAIATEISRKADIIQETVRKSTRDIEDMEQTRLSALNEWFENDERIEAIATETSRKTEKIQKTVEDNTRDIKDMKNTQRSVLFVGAFCFAVFVGCWCFQSYFLKKPDYFYPHNFSNPDFVGREWVFQQLVKILNTTDVRGIQLVADPGWGKSTIMERLIDSPSSSPVIHENIIGYHFCKFNEKNTSDAELFVKKLVQLIGKKIPEFLKIVNNDLSIQKKLNFYCNKNPVQCFQDSIVEPLKKLTNTGKNNSFILIDALDECLEEERHKSMIPKILSNSAPELPHWVKVIITSRKQPLSAGKISKLKGFETLKMNVEDHRNEKDIHAYAEHFFRNFYTEVPSTVEKSPLNQAIDLAVEFSKGNFLHLKTIIKYLQKYPHKLNTQSIPESLGDIYTDSFTERFKEKDFDRFELLLEVLLAAKTPPTLSELDKILNHYDKTYKTKKVANKLSEYFKSDIEQGPLEFYHQFFAEWLLNQTGDNEIDIQKSKGHQYIVDYLFHYYDERQTNITYEELSELCFHILHGKAASESYKRKLSFLKVSEIGDSSERCILHDLATKNGAAGLIDVLIKQFDSVDVLDNSNWTPAMYAVSAGNYENVELFIKNGANVNHTAKRTFCFFWDFMVLRGSYETNSSMSFIAAYRGYTKIAKFLVRKGAEVNKTDDCGWKPLYAAAVMGHFEIVQLHINKGVQADAISLHHAAVGNHTEIVRFLLNTGVHDKCLPCKPGNKSWCRFNLNRFHNCFCETALHAAIARDNLEVAELLLEYGNESVNCKHGSGRTPLMEAFLRNNIQMVKLLINAGAEIDAVCESATLDLFHECSFMAYEEHDSLYSRYCDQPVCHNGYRIMDFAMAHGMWKSYAKNLEESKKLITFVNESQITAAAIYDQVDFINTTHGDRIDSIPNIETVLRYVAVCHSVKTLKYLLESGVSSKFTVVYEDGKTLLHFAALGSSKFETETYVTQSCTSSACVCPNKTRAGVSRQKCLETVMLLTQVLLSEINKQDIHGRTVLHYAAVHGELKLVQHLINAGADWSIKDHRGETPAEFAVRERSLEIKTSHPCQSTIDQVFRVCHHSSMFDEMISYLLQNATITNCDITTKNLLSGLIFHQLPLSLYALFKSGLNVNCSRKQFKRYLNKTVPKHWNRRHDDILEVFKIFQIDVEVTCNVPFSQSELHLMAYLGTPSFQVGNLFKSSVNGNSFPLQRFITSHSKGVEILNKCYDKEGYLAIHRAVQGGNFDAVSWFVEIGVDFSKKTKFNSTTLVLATYSYPTSSTFSPVDNIRIQIFEKVLEKMKEKGHVSFRCNNDVVDLSPLHVAGSRGMGMLEVFRRKMPEFPLICTNSHEIQPIYLAYLYHATNPYMSWSDKQAFEHLGLSPETGPPKFPKREAEYHLIYNQFYRSPLNDLRNMLNHEGLFECPGISELLPHKTVILKYIREQRCHSNCWESSFKVSQQFSSNFPNLVIQTKISNPFTDRFLDIDHHMAELRFHLVKMFHFNLFHFTSTSSLEKILWRKVTKAHSCIRNCVCFEIMQLLQEKFTNEAWKYKIVGKFVAERMAWTDTSTDGDVKYRWPFSFLLKKALRMDKEYKYLEILSPRF